MEPITANANKPPFAFVMVGIRDQLYGTGVYTAVVVPVPVTKSQVAAMLPAALTLAPQTVTAPLSHPLLFMLGAQSEVRPHPMRLFRWNYLEFAVGIPFVQWRERPTETPFFFMPKLYLNRRRPILAGGLYGFAKRRATIGMSDTHYMVNDFSSNQLLLSAEYEIGAVVEQAEKIVAHLLQPTLIGQTQLGHFARSTFNWHLERAHIQAVAASLKVAYPFLPGLPLAPYYAPQLADDMLGAFRITTQWALSWPRLISSVA